MGHEIIVRHRHSIHFHLRVLLEVADNKDNDNDDDLPSREPMTVRSGPRAELKQLIEQSAT
jgi:hypothetical protein